MSKTLDGQDKALAEAKTAAANQPPQTQPPPAQQPPQAQPIPVAQPVRCDGLLVAAIVMLAIVLVAIGCMVAMNMMRTSTVPASVAVPAPAPAVVPNPPTPATVIRVQVEPVTPAPTPTPPAVVSPTPPPTPPTPSPTGKGALLERVEKTPKKEWKLYILNGLQNIVVVRHDGREIAHLGPGQETIYRMEEEEGILTATVLCIQGRTVGVEGIRIKWFPNEVQDVWVIKSYQALR